MPHLEVPGAQLYYETIGTGPLLLLISGGNGSGDLWRILADQLKSHFTVVIYDRRGFSRSHLIGPQDYEHRIETDADDASLLIKHLSGDGGTTPATVVGNSSGAIVSLELLCRHPECIRVVVAHEPPAMRFVPDCDDLWAMQNDIYKTYRKSGIAPALEMFADMIKAGKERQGLVRGFASADPYVKLNTIYWFERELLDYPYRQFDIEVLEKQKDRLLLANGADSNKEALQFRANVALGEKLGLEVKLLPAMHVGFATHPKGWAQGLLNMLKEKNDFYATI